MTPLASGVRRTMAPQISVHGAEAARQFRSPAVEIPRRALRTSRPNVLFRASYALIVVHYGTRKRRSKNLIKAAMLSGWNCKCLEDRRTFRNQMVLECSVCGLTDAITRT